jgi:hypothetical protein
VVGHGLRDRAPSPPLLGQSDEEGASAGDHYPVLATTVDRALVGAATDRALAADHDDVAFLGGVTGGVRSGIDDADQGQGREVPAKLVQRDRRRGVAGDDEHLDAAFDEDPGRLPGVARDRPWALGPVRQPGGIPEVEEGLARKSTTKGAQHGEPADA